MYGDNNRMLPMGPHFLCYQRSCVLNIMYYLNYKIVALIKRTIPLENYTA